MWNSMRHGDCEFTYLSVMCYDVLVGLKLFDSDRLLDFVHCSTAFRTEGR